MTYERHRDQFANMLDSRFYTIEWLDYQIVTGAIQVLSSATAAILYEFKTYPTGWKELNGMAAAGKLESIINELIPAAEEIAKAMGCGSAQIESRAGWGKKLKPSGYRPFQYGIIKFL